MGALHAGHMALIAKAKRRADSVAPTIFVNPTQFGANEDFRRYPRREAEDAGMLEEAGCDLLWLPAVGDIYPEGFSTRVSVSGVSDRWEGEARPGHFDGVATIVAKLLLSVGPDLRCSARRTSSSSRSSGEWSRISTFRVEIVGVPTVREADGFALSSRNAYLLGRGARRRRLHCPALSKTARARNTRRNPVFQALDEARSIPARRRLFADRLFRAGRCRDARAARGTAWRNAPHRRGGDRRHAAHRQSRHLTWLNRVNHLFAVRGRTSVQQRTEGTRNGGD